MKNFARMLFAPNLVALFLSAATQVAAQPTRVVTYPKGAASTKMPAFKKAVIAINFGGPLAADVKKTLMKKYGVRQFAEGPNPCRIPDQPLICLSFGESYSVPFAGSGYYSNQYSSSNPRRSNSNFFSQGVAQSGDQYDVTFYAVLIDANGGQIELGESSSSDFAGSTQSSFSSFGFGARYGGSSYSNRNGGGSSYASTMTPAEVAVAKAQKKAALKLLGSNWWRHLDDTTHAQWFPTSAALVDATFGK